MNRPASGRATSRADIVASIERRMQQQNPNAAADGPNETTRTLIRLHIRSIDLYERNPRTKPNGRLADIKDAIRNTGENEQPPIVTRRPGAERYVVAAGGNTRVQAQNELYDETGEAKFAYIDCVYKPYTNETDLLAAHIAENSNREDLCFWDNAHAIMALRTDLERDRGKPFSLRELSDELGRIGVTAGRQWLSVFRFTVDRLGKLEHAGLDLSSKDVQDRIQPAWSRITRLAEKFSVDATALDEQVFQPALEMARMAHERSGKLDVPALILSFSARLGELVDIGGDDVDRLTQVIDRQPDMDEAGLRALVVPAEQTSFLSSVDTDPDEIATQESAANADPDDQVNAAEDSLGSEPDFAASSTQSELSVTPPVQSSPQQSSPAQPAPPRIDRRPAAPLILADEPAAAIDVIDAIAAHNGPSTTEARAALAAAVRAFASACAIAGCVRETEALPLWFMVEPPQLEAGERPLDAQAADGVRPERYFGWWWLVFLTNQNTPAGMQVVPDGAFARLCASDTAWDAACDDVLGEQIGPDQFYRIVASMCDPADPVGALHFDLLQAVRRVRQLHPERFCSQFWIAQGVDPRFAEEV